MLGVWGWQWGTVGVGWGTVAAHLLPNATVGVLRDKVSTRREICLLFLFNSNGVKLTECRDTLGQRRKGGLLAMPAVF